MWMTRNKVHAQGTKKGKKVANEWKKDGGNEKIKEWLND